MSPRAVFFGTPALAVPALRALAETTDLVGVVCQPDKPAGRGLKLTEPAVKLAAQELGVEVHQPVKVKTGNLDEWLLERRADVAIVLAYGRILPPAVLRAPRLGCLNLHASLLPKYRGASPINWAIVEGESETGISLMQMDEGLDTGPVFTRRVIPIGDEETAGELAERLAALAAVVVDQDVPRVIAGKLVAEPQDDALATYAPLLTREHCRLHWTWPSRQLVDRVRGLAPRPGAFTTASGKSLRVLRARAAAPLSSDPGTVHIANGRIFVSADDGAVEILEAQLEGRKALRASELVNGRALRDGDRLGGPDAPARASSTRC